MKSAFLTLLFLLTSLNMLAQCIPAKQIKVGGSYQSDSFIDYCPYYNYMVNAEKQTTGYHYTSRPIDLVPANFQKVKENLENNLIKRVGKDLVDRLKFKGVSISAYDSIRKFESRYPVVDMSRCFTKYFFYYDFVPVEGVNYCVGIAVNDNQQIISNLPLPQTEEKLAIDYSVDICKILEIAKETGTKIEPIDFITFEFDFDKQEFFWVVRQKIVNPKKGLNEYNQILIEARDPSQVVSYRQTVYIE